MVDVQCVGAGGGSIARVRQGSLLVGPESAGSSPGPVCYRRGGEQATVTDADAVLGYLPLDRFAGGRMSLDVASARDAIARDVADPLGIDVVDAAWGVERIVNANMADATRRVLAGSGVDARHLDLIAYGGNGPVHAWAIAAELGMDRVLVPEGGARLQRARPARVGLQGRPDPQPRQSAVADRPGRAPRHCSTSSTVRSPTSSLRPACRPSRSRACATCRWPTPARTST